MLPSFTAARPRQMSEVLKWEGSQDYSRESAPLLAGEVVQLGQPVAKVGGKVVPFDPAGTDGSETIVGVSLMDAEAVGADLDFVLYVARLAVVSASGLRGLDALAAPAKAAALADIAALGIVVREF